MERTTKREIQLLIRATTEHAQALRVLSALRNQSMCELVGEWIEADVLTIPEVKAAVLNKNKHAAR